MTNATLNSLPGGADNRFAAQRVAAQSLAPHTFRLELRGAPNDLAWPRICAYCGAGASEQITVRKASRRRRGRRSRGSGLSDFKVASAPVPFCAGCAQEHRATVQRPTTLGVLFGFLFHPLIIPVIGAGYFLPITFRAARGLSLTEPAGQIGWGLFALMLFIIVWTTVLWWRTTTPSRLEPQTEITRACDFSADVSQMFEGERRIYAMRNETFAQAFEAANADRRWTEADQARSRRWAPVLALALLVGLAGIVGVIALFER